MNQLKIIKLILNDLADQITHLSEEELLKIGEGTHELTVKIAKKKLVKNRANTLSDNKNEEFLKLLQGCQSREEGLILLTENLKYKKEIEQFARFLDVLVFKQDKVDLIKEKIIEATVGAVLRSSAIQGKNIK